MTDEEQQDQCSPTGSHFSWSTFLFIEFCLSPADSSSTSVFSEYVLRKQVHQTSTFFCFSTDCMAAVFVRHSWTHSVKVVSVFLKFFFTCESSMNHLLSLISFSYGHCNAIFTGPHVQATHIRATSLVSFNSHMAVDGFLSFLQRKQFVLLFLPVLPPVLLHTLNNTALLLLNDSCCVFKIKCPEI